MQMQGGQAGWFAERSLSRRLVCRCSWTVAAECLAEALDDACLLMLTFEGRLVCCCLLAGKVLPQLAVCLLSMPDACGTMSVCSVVLDL